MLTFAALAVVASAAVPHTGAAALPTLGKGKRGKGLVGLGPISSCCSTGSLLFPYAVYM